MYVTFTEIVENVRPQHQCMREGVGVVIVEPVQRCPEFHESSHRRQQSYRSVLLRMEQVFRTLNSIEEGPKMHTTPTPSRMH